MEGEIETLIACISNLCDQYSVSDNRAVMVTIQIRATDKIRPISKKCAKVAERDCRQPEAFDRIQ